MKHETPPHTTATLHGLLLPMVEWKIPENKLKTKSLAELHPSMAFYSDSSMGVRADEMDEVAA